jgi:hypothetical protein
MQPLSPWCAVLHQMVPTLFLGFACSEYPHPHAHAEPVACDPIDDGKHRAGVHHHLRGHSQGCLQYKLTIWGVLHWVDSLHGRVTVLQLQLHAIATATAVVSTLPLAACRPPHVPPSRPPPPPLHPR